MFCLCLAFVALRMLGGSERSGHLGGGVYQLVMAAPFVLCQSDVTHAVLVRRRSCPRQSYHSYLPCPRRFCRFLTFPSRILGKF